MTCGAVAWPGVLGVLGRVGPAVVEAFPGVTNWGDSLRDDGVRVRDWRTNQAPLDG